MRSDFTKKKSWKREEEYKVLPTKKEKVKLQISMGIIRPEIKVLILLGHKSHLTDRKEALLDKELKILGRKVSKMLMAYDL